MRTIATTLALAVLLAAAVTGSASAVTIAASPAGSVSAGGPFGVSTTAGDVNCVGSFSGTLNGSIPASVGAAWGDFRGGTLSSCITTGSIVGPILVLWSVLPTITVTQILGTPPTALTGVRVTRTPVTISFTVLGVTCLYRGPVDYLAPFVTLRNGDRAVGTFTALAGQTLPLIFGSAPPCPRVATVTGTTWQYGTLQRVDII